MLTTLETKPVVLSELDPELADWVEETQDQTPLAIPRALENFRRYYELRRTLFDILRAAEETKVLT